PDRDGRLYRGGTRLWAVSTHTHGQGTMYARLAGLGTIAALSVAACGSASVSTPLTVARAGVPHQTAEGRPGMPSPSPVWFAGETSKGTWTTTGSTPPASGAAEVGGGFWA